MIKGKNLVAVLRRDAHFVWNVAIAVVFLVFAGLAIAAALIDVWSIHH